MAEGNRILYQNTAAVVTANTTLGFNPGQTAPPRFLICKAGANNNITITLPLSTAVLPSQTGVGGSPIPAAGPGFAITVFGESANSTITVAAATGDTLVGGANNGTVTQNVSKTYVSSIASENTWYQMGD